MKKDQPLVSIIMPTFNRPTYLKRAIDSCLNQTYDNIEVLVIDDNNPSSDARKNTEKFINKLYSNNKKVVYLKMDKNSGACKARNKAIFYSNAKYITFLDDDDEYYPNNIEEEVKFITKNDYDMIFCNVDIMNDRTKEIIHRKYTFDFEFTTENLLRRQLTAGISGGISFMYRTSVLKELGGFEDIKASQEYILLLKTIGEGYKIGFFDFTGALGHNIEDEHKITGSKKAIEGKIQSRKFKDKYLYALTKNEIREMDYNFVTFIYRQYRKHKDIKCIWWGMKKLFYIDYIIKNKRKRN